MTGDLDADGYPTPETLAKVTDWPWEDPMGLMAFVHSVWWAPDWGWHAEEPGDWTDEVFKDTEARTWRFRVSTGGWSGNESLIDAMRDNSLFWLNCWYSERRGGHFEFRVKVRQ